MAPGDISSAFLGQNNITKRNGSLIKVDVNWRAYDKAKWALDSVAEQEDFETLNNLLIAKAEMNAKSKDYGCLTVIQAAAAKGGHLEVVVKLMTAKVELNAEVAEYIGQTASQAAAKKGNFEIVDKFLVAKAGVNAGAAEYMGRTALQAAAEKGHYEIFDTLLVAKAGVNAKAGMYSGRRGLQGAAEQGHLEVVYAIRGKNRRKCQNSSKVWSYSTTRGS